MKKNLIEVREENEGAFTLIELLVVILIIGILAAIAIPVFLNQRKAAVDASVKSDVKNAATQVETWAVANPSKSVPSFEIKNGTVTPTAPTTSADVAVPLSDIKSGKDTNLKIVGTSTGKYTITGTNENGTDTVKNTGIIYNSDTGGLK